MNSYKAIKVNGVKRDEHRYLMEQHLGRKLNFNEVVHHKDNDKKNNQLWNLEVMTRSGHSSMHMKIEKRLKSSNAKIAETLRKARINSKINFETSIEVKSMYEKGMRQVSIAKLLNVSKYAIHRICKNAQQTTNH
jgi:transcriptional regulator